MGKGALNNGQHAKASRGGPLKGGVRAASSYKTTPSDQMSVFSLYGWLSHSSGLAYSGVP